MRKPLIIEALFVEEEVQINSRSHCVRSPYSSYNLRLNELVHIYNLRCNVSTTYVFKKSTHVQPLSAVIRAGFRFHYIDTIYDTRSRIASTVR